MAKRRTAFSPPRWADWLLESCLSPHLLEDVLGDLHEVFYKRIGQIGLARARREYGWAVLHYLRPYFFKRKPSEYPSPSLLNLSMLRNYLTIALRNLVRNKAYSIINIVGLSIGLSAAMLIILYTKDEVSYDRFHTNNPNIYRIVSKNITPGGTLEGLMGNTGYFQGPKFRDGVPEIRSFVRYQEDRRDILIANEIKSQDLFLADANFFSVFSFPLLSGNPQTALQQPRSVVISERMAEGQFGTTEALGKIIQIKENGQLEPYTVTGVAAQTPQNSSIKFDILLPMIVREEEMTNPENWFNIFLNTFVILTPNANIGRVESKMNQIYVADAHKTIKEMAGKYGLENRTEYILQPFADMHLNKELPADHGLVDSSNPMFSYILSGIALFILGIACINFVNLTVARSLKRAKEIGIRKVVGSGRTQLTVQFLGESFLLCLLAFVFAIVLVQVVLPTFNQLANKALSLSYLFDARLVACYIELFLMTGLLAGFYPALVLSGYSPVQTLYSRFRLSGKNYLQKSLVVLQFAIASFLIIGTLTIYSQFDYLTTKSLGYDDTNVISLTKSSLKQAEAKLLREALLKNPTIMAVAPKNGGRWRAVARVKGETQLAFALETVGPDFLPLLRIPVVNGRNFSADLPTDSTQSVLVNETFVKQANWQNPLGQEISYLSNNDVKYRVIGVVKDYHFASLNEAIGPQLFTMNPKRPSNGYGQVLLKIRSGSETTTLQYIEKTVKRLFPLNPYSYKFLDEENRRAYESEAKWRQIMLFGAILTIFISCIGLFGLATLSAERRTKEIGVRKVLGASVTSIVQLLSSDFLKLVGISFVVAFPMAYYAIDKWLQNYPYRIDISVWTFVGAAVLAILIAFFTVSFQSIRAALTNPVKSLRSE